MRVLRILVCVHRFLRLPLRVRLKSVKIGQTPARPAHRAASLVLFASMVCRVDRHAFTHDAP